MGWAAYSKWLVDELPLCLQRVRELADSFPFWQRRAKTGRPPTPERDLLIAFLVRTFFDSTFSQTEMLLKLFQPLFDMRKIPDSTTLSRKNRSKRWIHLWKRFHKFVMDKLPKRKATIATDATGWGAYLRSWSDTPYDVRACQNWVKVHASMEVDSNFILSYKLTPSNVHESQVFEDVWEAIPENVDPSASLADGSYSGLKCLMVAKAKEATPYHGIRKDAMFVLKPTNQYQKMVNFARHFPNRFCEKYSKRAQIESAFGAMKKSLGYRIRCRTERGRKNEVQAKISAHNIKGLAQLHFMCTK